jgi:hypothetical protein
MTRKNWETLFRNVAKFRPVEIGVEEPRRKARAIAKAATDPKGRAHRRADPQAGDPSVVCVRSERSLRHAISSETTPFNPSTTPFKKSYRTLSAVS